MPAGPSPPRARVDLALGRIGRPLRRRRGHPLGGPHGRARRGVDLAVVVQLDDLRRLEERRGHLGEAHHQHRRDGEVRCDHAMRRSVAERMPGGVDVGLVEPGGAHHGVHAVHRQPWQRDASCGRDREVDDDVARRVGEAPELTADRDDSAVRAGWDLGAGDVRIDGRHELQIGIDRDRPTHRRSHPPTCAVDADPNRHVSDGSRVRARSSAVASPRTPWR